MYIDIIYTGLYTYRYAYMYIKFQVCRLRAQKKRWIGSSCYQKPMIYFFTFYIRDDPVDALPNPGNNGISMDLYHIIRLLFEFFHQQRGGFFWDVVFHEVRCLPLEAAVCWDDFEGTKKPFSRCRCFLFSSLWKFTLQTSRHGHLRPLGPLALRRGKYNIYFNITNRQTLGGGFKHFLFLPLFGKKSHFD